MACFLSGDLQGSWCTGIAHETRILAASIVDGGAAVKRTFGLGRSVLGRAYEGEAGRRTAGCAKLPHAAVRARRRA